MRTQNYLVVHNCIITDPMLYSSSKRVMCTLLAYCGPKDILRKSIEELAALSGCCCATVRKALDELEARGFIRRIHCFRTSQYFSRPVRATSIYQIRRCKLRGGYTMIPRELLTAEVSHSAFVTALYIYKTAGRKGRSWPSLRTAAKRLDLAKATICRALEALRRLQLIVRYFCIMANRAYSCNSYYPTAWVRAVDKEREHMAISLHYGGLIFNEHLFINKIAKDLIKRKRDKGVYEFGDLYSFLDDLLCSGFYSPVLAINTT